MNAPAADTYGTPPGGPFDDDTVSNLCAAVFCLLVACAFMLVAFPLVIVPSL